MAFIDWDKPINVPTVQPTQHPNRRNRAKPSSKNPSLPIKSTKQFAIQLWLPSRDKNITK